MAMIIDKWYRRKPVFPTAQRIRNWMINSYANSRRRRLLRFLSYLRNKADAAFQIQVFGQNGFTLIEVMIAMVVGLIAVGAIYSVYISQMRVHTNQKVKIALQQDLRAAIIVMAQEIRMAGFDPEDTGEFGIVDIGRYNLVDPEADTDGSPAFFYTLDEDENGGLEGGQNGRNKEHCSFCIRVKKNRRYLAWNRGMGRMPLAENIKALGFAYGVDVDGDGELDRYNNGPNVLWAVDSDNGKDLDTYIDTNDDGKIDEADDGDGDGRIEGCPIDSPIPLRCIKAVRVWLLAQSDVRFSTFSDNTVYVIGDQLYPAANDGYIRQVLETVVECRNL